MPIESDLLCSIYSLSLGEPLFGTAPRTDIWILIEYPYPYASRAYEESDLPLPIKERLSSVLQSCANPRLLLIKKHHDEPKGRTVVFIAVSNPQAPRMYRYELAKYDELLAVDWEGVIKGDKSYSENHLHNEELYLICTNGKRDRCCAKNGLPLHEAIAAIKPENTWQSSHVGGHRFAGNLVCLPHGLYYGRVPADKGRKIVDAYRSGQIVLDHFRGRSCYTPEQQAAEYYLREQTGEMSIDGFRLVESRETDPDHWSITFDSQLGRRYRLKVCAELSEYALFESCSKPENRNQQILYQLQSIKVE